ncbi:MAG: hypothetical protein QOI50_2579 [Pseudonocardiales bacterium]|jgi:hypothetical protein|nr:hypothetical protein [Pseudonocardiales bacterium]
MSASGISTTNGRNCVDVVMNVRSCSGMSYTTFRCTRVCIAHAWNRLERVWALRAAAVCERLDAIDQLLASGLVVDSEVEGGSHIAGHPHAASL